MTPAALPAVIVPELMTVATPPTTPMPISPVIEAALVIRPLAFRVIPYAAPSIVPLLAIVQDVAAPPGPYRPAPEAALTVPVIRTGLLIALLSVMPVPELTIVVIGPSRRRRHYGWRFKQR